MEFTIIPEWCLPAALGVCASLVLFAGFGAILIYGFAYTLLIMISSRPVTLTLSKETMIIDRAKELFGFRKKRGGRLCFMGFKYEKPMLEYLRCNPLIHWEDQVISKTSPFMWHFLAIGVCIAGTLARSAIFKR